MCTRRCHRKVHHLTTYLAFKSCINRHPTTVLDANNHFLSRVHQIKHRFVTIINVLHHCMEWRTQTTTAIDNWLKTEEESWPAEPFRSFSLKVFECAAFMAFCIIFLSLGSKILTGCLLAGGGFNHFQRPSASWSCKHIRRYIWKRLQIR